MSSRTSGFVALIILFASFPRATLAQSIAGTFSGVVKDQAGPVFRAEVRITNLATAQVRFVFTDHQGRYELLEVPPGQYELRVSKDGYNVVTTSRSQGLQLGLAQVARVSDIILNVAPAGAAIIDERALDVAMTDSDRPTIGTAFDGQQLRNLPLSARDVNNLAVLAPGAASATSFSFVNTLVPFSVNGSRGRDNNFIIDSVDNNEPLFGGAATQFSNSEIFSEFRILTGQFQAEYGRNSGGIVNVITRQGGKEVHGSLFWYGQNDGLNAMTKVEKESQLKKPARFYDNQLGASIGGPLRKDSTRYFLSYQWDRARNDLSSEYPVVVTVPTSDGLSMLQTINAANQSPTLAAFLADPTVRSLPTLVAPCAIQNPSSQTSASNPCTTGTVAVNGTQIPFGTYLVPKGNVFDYRDHQGFARIDQKVGQRENLFFRYLLDDLRTPFGVFADPKQLAFSDVGLLPQWRTILAARTQNFGSSWTHALARALNEVRFSFSRTSSEKGPLDATPRLRELPEITITDQTDQSVSKIGLFSPAPSAGFPAAGNFISFGSDTRSARVKSNLFQLQENFSLSAGTHNLKFGGNFFETRSDLRQINEDLGRYFYVSFQDFVNNIPIFGFQRFGNLGGKGGATLPLQQFSQFYFAEDDIKVSPHFILNLGIRFENYSQAFNAVVDRSASNPDSPPRLSRLNTNFGPRVGFAWGLGKGTVLRGGYGIYYDPMFFNIALLEWQSGSISPFVSSSATDLNPLATTPNAFPNPPFSPNDAYGHFINNRGCSGISTTGPTPTFLDCTNENTVSPNLRNPFVHDASLSMQHQLGKDFSFEASYFGSRGTKLFQRLDLNPYGGWQIVSSPQSTGIGCLFATPGTPCTFLRPRIQQNRGAIIEMSNGAFSNYHALQLSSTKRLRGTGLWNGMALTGSYTWSHMTDNASEVFGPSVLTLPSAPGPNFLNNLFDFSEPFETSTPFPQNASDPRKGEKANSSFDRRHRLSLSLAWALPSPGPKVERTLLGNWELNGVISAESGQPFTPINSSVSTPGGSFSTFGATRGGFGAFQPCGDVGGDGIVFNDRPNIGNPRAPANTVAILNNFFCLDPNNAIVQNYLINNPNALFKIIPGCGEYITPDGKCVDPKMVRFVQVPLGGGPGNAGRNILTGPGTINIDLSVSKSFGLGERLRVQFRADAYNLLNTENPGPFAGNSYIASAQQLPAVAFYPAVGVGPDCFLFPGSSACSPPTTFARTNGLTPENAIDTTDAGTGKSLFLSHKFLTTSSRRMQLSLKFTF